MHTHIQYLSKVWAHPLIEGFLFSPQIFTFYVNNEDIKYEITHMKLCINQNALKKSHILYSS